MTGSTLLSQTDFLASQNANEANNDIQNHDIQFSSDYNDDPIESYSHEHLEQKTKINSDHKAALIFPEQTIKESGFDEFGFVILLSHRANQLLKGAEPTVNVKHDEKEPIVSLLEVASGSVSLGEMKHQYLNNADDNITHTEYYSGLSQEEDQYASNLSNKTDMSEEFMGLSALFSNPND